MTMQERSCLDEAERLYLMGNEYRRKGMWHDAMNCYSEALDIDPESPAKEAREMLASILNFRCKDIYNP